MLRIHLFSETYDPDAKDEKPRFSVPVPVFTAPSSSFRRLGMAVPIRKDVANLKDATVGATRGPE